MTEKNFEGLRIGIASPEKIRSWSYGEVKKPETINYRTLKPEKDGLFCEKIFGPSKDFECSCGKYKRLRYKDIVCDRCGVEVTYSKVRRERMGHIELATPVSHIWFFKGVPSRMGLVLDMSPRDLEEVLYFVSYVVLDPGVVPLVKKQTLSDADYRAYYEKYGSGFKVGKGAEAIKQLLKEVNIDKEVVEIREKLGNATGQKKTRLSKRLDIMTSLQNSNNKPEWMILDALPVLPPELRPMIQLDGGRFATSDLNDLYRRVINRNNRLKKLLELGAPGIIVQNEKRMLQEAVDALFDNGRRGRSVNGPGNRPLKSFSQMLKGKQGRFRQNLLGKRVDYSGRSVIVVGPSLKMHQCGMPKGMAIEMFKPYIIHGLVEREIATNIKAAKKMIEKQDFKVWDVVEDVIRLHPLVCEAFNADFDGDQMAVHLPLSEEAKAEARLLMLGANNILHPKDGKPIVTPSQDMILGNYYLTVERKGAKGEGNVFRDINEAIMSYEREETNLQALIAIPVNSFKHKVFTAEQKNHYLITTIGKLLFNEILPDSFPFINEPTELNIKGITPENHFVPYGTDFKKVISKRKEVEGFIKGTLQDMIAEVFKRYQTTATTVMLDKLKDLGFKYSTVAGISIATSDFKISEIKDEVLAAGDEIVKKINDQFKKGLITEEERHNKVLEVWYDADNKIQDNLKIYTKTDKDNPVFVMMNSNARGSMNQFKQITGIRGLLAKPNGETVEIPIKSSFKDGLSVAEFFLSTHGARKGLADTALNTAKSGYLTRRLVDVAQDVIVREHDCGSDQGVVVSEFVAGKTNEVIESLYSRIIGRYTTKKVIHPKTGEIVVDKDEFITEKKAEAVVAAGVKSVEIRSVLTCRLVHGVCTKCYGSNLATGKLVEIGEAVGVMAAQSIGEPGTQLTMRTFHTGGVAGVDDITQGLPRVEEIFEARIPKVKATIAEINGKISEIVEENGKFLIMIKNENTSLKHTTLYGIKVIVEIGDEVKAGEKLTEGVISPKELLAVTDPIVVQQYILKEVQKVYSSTGVDINDKHVEIIARKMVSKIRISDSGDTNLISETTVDINSFTKTNKDIIIKGKKPAVGKAILLGITKASLGTDSFLSAASFQETTRVLTDAAIKGKVDELRGLKENVILGRLIPAGTGATKYKDVKYDLKYLEAKEEVFETLEDELM